MYYFLTVLELLGAGLMSKGSPPLAPLVIVTPEIPCLNFWYSVSLYIHSSPYPSLYFFR